MVGPLAAVPSPNVQRIESELFSGEEVFVKTKVLGEDDTSEIAKFAKRLQAVVLWIAITLYEVSLQIKAPLLNFTIICLAVYVPLVK